MIRNLMFTIMLSILLVLAACDSGDLEEDPVTDPNEEPATEQNEESRPTESKEDEGQLGDANEEVMTETGIYNGQADVHTIEIETEDGPVAFQLSLGARDDVEELTEEEEVTYTYWEDGDERVIESIEPVKE